MIGLCFGKPHRDWVQNGHWSGAVHGGMVLTKWVRRHWGLCFGGWFFGVTSTRIFREEVKVTVDHPLDEAVSQDIVNLQAAVAAGKSKPLVFNDQHKVSCLAH